MIALCIQIVLILHDVFHGASFPQLVRLFYFTLPLADLFSWPWVDIIMGHFWFLYSTLDPLVHDEFCWGPAGWPYALQEWIMGYSPQHLQ